MSSPRSAKRRKLEHVNQKLSKPFVSPMRTSKPDPKQPKENSSKANIGLPAYTPSTLAHTVLNYHPDSQIVPTKPSNIRSNFNPSKSTPLRKQQSFSTLSSSTKKTSSEEQEMQKSILLLERQIRKVTNEVDTLRQAHKLSTSTTDDELRELSEKWRLCCQSVAEELFGTVKERVCRMGGVAAWRETEKQKYDRAHGLREFAQQEAEVEDDDADCEFDSEGEELPEDEQEYRKKMKRKALEELREAADEPHEPEIDPNAHKGQVWQEAGQDDDTFTMDMMLRSLNIDLAVIGYDKETQRWT